MDDHLEQVRLLQRLADYIAEVERLQRTVQRQEKDIEQLTYACQLLLRRNKELLDDQRRNPQAVV